MKSKTQKFYFIFIGVLGVMLALLMLRSYLAKQTAETYLADMQLTHEQLQYASIAAPLWSDGIILYQVQFPQLKAPHRIEKMIVHKEANKISIRLLGVSVNVLDILRGENPLVLKKRLFSYQPAQAFHYPLESLAFSGIQEIEFDMTVRLKKEEAHLALYASLNLKNQAQIYLTGLINRPIQLDEILKNPLLLAQTDISKPILTLKNKGLIERYNTYLSAIEKPAIMLENNTLKITPDQPIILNQVIKF